jgi:hypothetical protein
MAQTQLALYCDHFGKPDQSRLVKLASPAKVTNSIAWIARMAVRGLALTEQERDLVEGHIATVCSTVHLPEIIESTKAPRVNVQDVMRERAREAAGELEGAFDDFIMAGPKTSEINVSPVNVLSAKNILPQHVSILTEAWQNKLNEFQEALDGKDPQLVEGYKHMSKTELKAMIKFCEAVLTGLTGYVTVKKASKTPRKRKAISPEKQVSKLKYLKQFEELKLTSVAPAKLVGASEIWLYDTAKRKLIYYIADGHVGTMTVKGTTIVGFDSTNSGTKTVRKPAETIKALMGAGKPAARKLFKDLKAVQTEPNGRTNENIIILKAW